MVMHKEELREGDLTRWERYWSGTAAKVVINARFSVLYSVRHYPLIGPRELNDCTEVVILVET